MGKTNKASQKNLKIIGNALIALSILSFFVIFFPIIKEEFRFRTQKIDILKPISQEFSIQIPVIGINYPIIENVDPWNKNEYLEALKQGVAHAQGTSLPNQDGSTFLFAHSTDFPWRINRYNTAFYRLGKLNNGDQIIVTFRGKQYHYEVFDKKIVQPEEISYIYENNQNQLILQTCWPIGTSLKRLLIFAE